MPMGTFDLAPPVLHPDDMDSTKIYSYADYLKWTFDERVELIKGKIFTMSPAPATIHQRIVLKLSVRIERIIQNKPCEVFVAPFDVRLPKKSRLNEEIYTVVQPDVCVICDPAKIDERGCIGSPDIVVEILSPGNNKKELQNKYEVYEEAGVKEYWVIHPEEKTFLKYALDAEGKYQPSKLMTFGDEITTSVLPGFTLKLDEIFTDSK